jgi:hypothetical protein
VLNNVLMYRSAQGRIAVDFNLLELPFSNHDAHSILIQKGYREIPNDIISLARSRIGQSSYRAGCPVEQAPGVVDCASFTRWLYGQLGLWLPRYCVQQRTLGTPVSLHKHQKGDLLFMNGYQGKFWIDESEKVGHVGIATGEGTIMHAACKSRGVVEDDIRRFIKDTQQFRGVRRLFPDITIVRTYEIRPGRLVEHMDDVRWDLLNTLGR